MNTFFIEPSQAAEDNILLEGELCHHLANVLRVKIGEYLRFSDNISTVYLGTVSEINKKNMIVHIDKTNGFTTEPPIHITLIQALPRGDKMEQIIQKTVELGVSVIVPVASDHSQVRLKGKEVDKAQRWQKIANAAAEQSGRERIPKVITPTSIEEALGDLEADTKVIFCYEKEGLHSLKKELYKSEAKKFAILIGPEGGFSQEEANLILAKGGVSVTMGPRILRVETAAPTAVAAVMYELGDWGCLVEN